MARFKIAIQLSALDAISAPLKRVKNSLDKISNSTRKATRNFQTLQLRTQALRKSLTRIGTGFRNVGNTLTTSVTLPIVGAGAAIITTAARFEKSMNKVRALTGATGKDFISLRELAKKLGATTKFSASQAADAMSFLGMAGFSTNEILQATPDLLNLAASSNIELARAADIASNIMGAFNIKASETGRVADVLAAVTASSNVNMEQLAESMKFAGPIAFQFGASLEDTAAAAGLLGNLGIQGTLAGTALRRSFLALAAPTTEASKLLSAAGITVTDSSGKMRRFGDIMTDLGKRLGNLPRQAQLQILDKLFGKIGITGASALKEFGKTGELIRFSNQMKNVTGTAKKMADIMNSGATGSVISLKSALEGLAISIADSGILQFFTDVVRDITDFVRSVTKTNPVLFRLGVVLGVVVSVLGPLLALIGLITTGMSTLTTVASVFAGVLSFLVSPIGLIIASLAALGTGIFLLTKNFDKVRAFLVKVFTDPKQAIRDLIEFAKKSFNSLVEIITNPLKSLKRFGGFVKGLLPRSITRFIDTGSVSRERRAIRTAPEFGQERRVAGASSSVVTKKSKVLIEINDKSRGTAKVKANIEDDDITAMGIQGALATGGI